MKIHWFVLTCLVASASFAAAQSTDPSKHSDGRRDSAQTDQRATPELWVFRASHLTGKEVRNSSGEKLGRIHDVVVDSQTGWISYAVLSFGGLLGVGDKLFAVPWDALSLKPRDGTEELIFVFNVDKSRLEAAPGFDQSAWPDMADPRWSRSVQDYWQDRPGRSQFRRMDAPPPHGSGMATPPVKRMRRINELISGDVKNESFKDIGDVEDLMVDVINGHVLYAVVDFDDEAGVLGENNAKPDDHYFVVPFTSLDLRPDSAEGTKDCFVLNLPESKRRSLPAFPERNWPNMSDRSWNERVHRYYGVRGFWTGDRHG